MAQLEAATSRARAPTKRGPKPSIGTLSQQFVVEGRGWVPAVLRTERASEQDGEASDAERALSSDEDAYVLAAE